MYVFLSVMLPEYFFNIFFFFNDTATTEIYTLSLHDALPICWTEIGVTKGFGRSRIDFYQLHDKPKAIFLQPLTAQARQILRSEEHTSELQSHLNLVCRLLLEKKKKLHTLPDRERLPNIQ